MKQVKKAFTLAETLITLVIVGVVAALTIPNLIAKYQEEKTVTQVKKAYSEFSQAFVRAVADYGSVETWDIGSYDSIDPDKTLYTYFKPYLIKVKECGFYTEGCFGKEYKSLTGESYRWQPNSYSKYFRGVLNDGTSFYIWSAGSGCNYNYGTGHFAKLCGGINIDINGAKKPNRAGKDFFGFGVTKYGVFPYGGPDYKSSYGLICDIKTNSDVNGIPCTAWIVQKGNMDYLYGSISW